jgi:hypothetical protein
MTTATILATFAPFHQGLKRFESKHGDCVLCDKPITIGATVGLSYSTPIVRLAHPECVESAGGSLVTDAAAASKARQAHKRLARASKPRTSKPAAPQAAAPSVDADALRQEIRAEIEAEYEARMTRAIAAIKALQAQIAALQPAQAA